MLTAEEQFFMEQMNAVRLDPLAGAARHGLPELNGPDPRNGRTLAGLNISADQKQPLSFDPILYQAAVLHGLDMLERDYFSHVTPEGVDQNQRIIEAGYDGLWMNENLSIRLSSEPFASHEPFLDGVSNMGSHMEGLLFSPSHRGAMLSPFISSVGAHHAEGMFRWNGDSFDSFASITVTKFGSPASRDVFLTGVAYMDVDGDGLYSVGEGVEGVTFAIRGGPSVESWSAGGYTIAMPDETGEVIIDITHGTSTFSVMVDLGLRHVEMDFGDFVMSTGQENVKIDLVDGERIMASSDLTLLEGARIAGLLGVGDHRLIGNDLDNTLIAGRGNNIIDGMGGINTVVFSGAIGDYDITHAGGITFVSDLRGGALSQGVNEIRNVRFLDFGGTIREIDIDDSSWVAPGIPDVEIIHEDPGSAHGLTISIHDRWGREADIGALTLHEEGAGEARVAQRSGHGGFEFHMAEDHSGTVGIADFTAGATHRPRVADALEALRIAVGIDPSWGPATPLDHIAADITGDGRVSTADALEILRIAVGLHSDHAPRWIFLDEEGVQSVMDGTHSGIFDNRFDISGSPDGADLSLTGILVGSLEVWA